MYAPISVTTATLTVTSAAHASGTIVLNRAAGITATLPAATGSGFRYTFVVGTTVTSNSIIIRVANSSDVMTGVAINAADGGDTAVMFETASTSDTITLNGTTTGGVRGDRVEVEDVAANLYYVRVVGSATGVEATPFSATV